MQTGDVPEAGGKMPCNFPQMFLRMADYGGFEVKVVHAARGEEPEAPRKYAGVIVTGSPAMVTDRAAWSENGGRWLAEAVRRELPVLGVCYGHQLLAQALGGRVDFHPDGLELGTHEVRLSRAAATHPLFSDCPESFAGNMAHSQTVVCPPEEALVLGYSRHDRHQILAYGERALGLQFHPEFDSAIMQAYVALKTGPGGAGGPVSLGLPVRDTPVAAGVLRRFVEICRRSG